jgi:large subunit ribosomal protein L15
VKLHDLKPAPGSRKARTRVGRGIAAGKGKTAGRGTKGQKARAGGSIPAWFEGGQTPIHIRVPKLRGFKRRFRVEYQVVNVGRIAEYAASGRFGVAGDEPATVNGASLAAAGLIRSDSKPIKILGLGEVPIKLFVAADAFTASARRKIEEAGGFVQLLAPDIEKVEAAPAAEPSPAAEVGEAAEVAEAAEAAQPAPAAEVVEPPSLAEPAPAEPAPSDEAAPPARRARRSATAKSEQPAESEPARAAPKRRSTRRATQD